MSSTTRTPGSRRCPRPTRVPSGSPRPCATTAGVEVTVCADLTFGALRGTVARFCADREPDEFALLYLACRSAVAPTGELVLAATDTDPHRLAETGLTADFLGRLPRGLLGRAEGRACWTARTRTAPGPTGSAARAGRGVPARRRTRPRSPRRSPTRSPRRCASVPAAGRGDRRRARSTPSAVRWAVPHPPRVATVSAVRADGRIPVSRAAAGRRPARRTAPADPPPDPAAAAGASCWPTTATWSRPAPARCRCSTRTGRATCWSTAGSGCCSTTSTTTAASRCPRAARAGRSLRASRHDDRTLWAGWPIVVLHGEPGRRALAGRRCAHRCSSAGWRWSPGTTAPGCARSARRCPTSASPHLRLGAEEATTLVATWVPGWHRGEARPARRDADRLLRDELGLLCLERLRPGAAGHPARTRTARSDGARNVAVLFTAGPTPGGRRPARRPGRHRPPRRRPIAVPRRWPRCCPAAGARAGRRTGVRWSPRRR